MQRALFFLFLLLILQQAAHSKPQNAANNQPQYNAGNSPANQMSPQPYSQVPQPYSQAPQANPQVPPANPQILQANPQVPQANPQVAQVNSQSSQGIPQVASGNYGAGATQAGNLNGAGLGDGSSANLRAAPTNGAAVHSNSATPSGSFPLVGYGGGPISPQAYPMAQNYNGMFGFGGFPGFWPGNSQVGGGYIPPRFRQASPQGGDLEQLLLMRQEQERMQYLQPFRSANAQMYGLNNVPPSQTSNSAPASGTNGVATGGGSTSTNPISPSNVNAAPQAGTLARTTDQNNPCAPGSSSGLFGRPLWWGWSDTGCTPSDTAAVPAQSNTQTNGNANNGGSAPVTAQMVQAAQPAAQRMA
ncbi:hypothetical protein O181_029370 [Austropuccinia psidii MF-1]|uniref:Uncharacterized protein n=1 Tax=Austropuccinia psidii MF-1 TaxID=1389203 RepID=A0A9Q3H548_9BASI|nr:hypothetical protein [Austropuccinia psidii MF-1]